MINVIFLILVLLFSFNIIMQKDANRIVWFIIGLLFFPHSIAFSIEPYITFPKILTYSLIISFLLFEKNFYTQFKESPFEKSLKIVFILFLLVGIFDERISYFSKVYRPVNYFIENFFLFFIVYSSVKTKKEYHKINSVLIYSFFLMCIYGIINFLTSSNIYIDIISDTYGMANFAESYMNPNFRLRISSFTWHPIYYGFILTIVISLTIFNFFYFKDKKKWFLIILLFFFFINLLLVNSRTPIATLLIIILIFFITGLELKRKIITLFLSILIIIASILFYSESTNIITDTIEIFETSGEGLRGSSIEMRYIQLGISYTIFKEEPITGHGFQYITEGLGYSSNAQFRTSDKNLFGFESYIFNLLIEQGLLGIIANLIFFTSLLIFFIKNIRFRNIVTKKISILTISFIIGHLVFIIGTGSMLTFPFMMVIYGMQAKYVVLSESENLT